MDEINTDLASNDPEAESEPMGLVEDQPADDPDAVIESGYKPDEESEEAPDADA